jgi:hypothetical protein
MKKLLFVLISFGSIATSFTQNIDEIITKEKVTQILAVLSHDSMEGRRVYTEGIDKAARFIETQMKKTGLDFFNNSGTYYQSFSQFKTTVETATAKVNKTEVTAENIICISPNETVNFTQRSDYKEVRIPKGKRLFNEIRPYLEAEENVVILADTSYKKDFERVKRFVGESEIKTNVVIALTENTDAKKYKFNIKNKITALTLSNVVGVLPGKTKPDEYIVFSAHYDHLGIRPDKDGVDSIYNGANDDASGTTAVLALAEYYKKMNNNERTLIFVAFTAEENGGFGSTYFSKSLNPDKVIAMYNIEMIGTDSKWGNNSAYITGYDESDFGKILQSNIAGSSFNFYPDPYPTQNLFYRSDNATLARLGVPAHTLSTSKMDSEKYYHTKDDEIETLNMENMTAIIKSIALSAATLVNGKDAPTRVKLR